MVRPANHVVIVLDDDERVSLVAQPVQDSDQSADVVRMQAGGRLVEDVKRVDQARAEGPGQNDALELAFGEAGRRPVELEVVEPDIRQIA